MGKQFIPTTIATRADLAALERDLRTGKRRKVGRFKIQVDGLESVDQMRLEVQLNRSYFACGCAESTFLGLLAGTAALVRAVPLGGDGVFAQVCAVAGAFVVGTVVGKIGGLAVARARLRSVVSVLRHHIGVDHAPTTNAVGCAVGHR